ncbi:unnamed protein product [Brachionus calyciflorus]|uniref:Ig-like domain-containing protein n=1 Tax=Brachionus calyciflorus TaxID=104777 RepID=A0A813V1F8_9BILA|nr:unnamed protein product [Brachionus calyciflorus]
MRFCILNFILLCLKFIIVHTAERCQSVDEQWSFDCSSRGVKWSNLIEFNDNERASIDLDLSSNDFYTEPQGHIIKNFSFNLFKQMNRRLNLSSNQFSQIEPYAFYYTHKIINDISRIILSESDLNILELTELDLSNNSFEIIPWNSIKNLPALTTLRLSLNPIKKLDLGDLDKNSQDYFRNLEHVYLNTSQIEYIDPSSFDLINNLKTLDISNNRIKFLDNFSNLKIRNFFIFNNPLECNCKLLWLRKFLQTNKQTFPYYGNIQHTCLVNTRSVDESYIVDSKTIFVNTTSLMVKNDPVDQILNKTRIERVPILDIDDRKFFCDIKLSSQIDNLSLPGQKDRKIQLECSVETYPEPEIKWLQGQKDLDRNLKISDNFQINEKRETGENLHKITSSLIITLDGSISQDSFSCRAFYKQEIKHNNKQLSRPIYSQKSVLFNIISDSIIQDINAYNQTFMLLNSTLSAYLASIQYNSLKDQPFIYFVIFSVLFIFCFLVILFVGVCLIRHKRAIRKEEKEYGYTGSDYSSINKRSTIYTGSNSLRADSSTIMPLKPDVIREHQDYTSIYGQFFRTPSKHSNYLNTLMISPESINLDDNESVYTNNNSIQMYHNPRIMQQSFDNNPVDASLYDDTRSTSHVSSKTFEENTEEYLEPKFDDLRKPQKYLKQSKI